MKRLLVILISLLAAGSVWAQVRLSASTDKTDLTLDDVLTLTVQVTGVSGTMVMPQLPSLPAFNIYSREAAQTSVNGRSTLEFKYAMRPRTVGQATIGPVTFHYGGKTYQTAPINVRIYRGQAPASAAALSTTNTPHAAAARTAPAAGNLPPLERALYNRAYAHAGEPYFMVAAVSRQAPYVNEPFTLVVRFYYAQSFYDAPYKNPSVTNLFIEEGPETQGQQTLQNRPYRYEEKRYTLSGVSAGKATISGATVSFRPGSSSLSLFDRFFGGAAVSPEQTVSAAPLELTIRPLPAAGKPASFYGAVGTGYTFTAQLDRPQTQAGEAVTWSATVQGPGNLKTTQDLTFPPVTGITAYPSAPAAGYLPNTKDRSYKTFQAELVPASSGTYTLPPVQWSYFDPQKGAYQALSTDALTLTVTPSTQTEKRVDFGAAQTTGNGVQTIGQDIRYVSSTYGPEPSLLTRLPAWKWLHVIALLWVAVCLFIASIGKKTAAKKHAYLAAKAHLKKAKTYEDVSDLLAEYLHSKWSISTGSLPLKDILQALKDKQVPAPAAQEFATVWKELESARFAPMQADTKTLAQLTDHTAQLLKKLEETK